MKHHVFAAAVALLTAAAAQAQTMPAESSPRDSGSPRHVSTGATMTPSSLSKADQAFAMKASEAGAAEVAEGKVAADKATRDDVKQFAQKMIYDHTKAGDTLKQIAAGEGVNLTEAPNPADQTKIDRLSAMKPGARLDRAYLRDQLAAHKQAVALFTKEASSGRDDRLKRFASETLPTLRDHLTMVTGLAKAKTEASSAQ